MFKRRASPSRSELIERKRRLEGEINLLRAELRRRVAKGNDGSGIQARIDRLRSEHYQTRLQIDRTGD